MPVFVPDLPDEYQQMALDITAWQDKMQFPFSKQIA